MRTHAARWVAVTILLTFAGGVARATNGCVQDAKSTYGECKGQCNGDYQDSRAICKGVSPGCFGACIDGRKECVDTARQPLTTCLDGCEAGLHQHRLDCKASSGCGGSGNPCSSNAAFIACMDPFQLAGFICRDACRDSFRLDAAAQSALKECARGFKACVKSCPPASPSGAFLDGGQP